MLMKGPSSRRHSRGVAVTARMASWEGYSEGGREGGRKGAQWMERGDKERVDGGKGSRVVLVLAMDCRE